MGENDDRDEDDTQSIRTEITKRFRRRKERQEDPDEVTQVTHIYDALDEAVKEEGDKLETVVTDVKRRVTSMPPKPENPSKNGD